MKSTLTFVLGFPPAAFVMNILGKGRREGDKVRVKIGDSACA